MIGIHQTAPTDPSSTHLLQALAKSSMKATTRDRNLVGSNLEVRIKYCKRCATLGLVTHDYISTADPL